MSIYFFLQKNHISIPSTTFFFMFSSSSHFFQKIKKNLTKKYLTLFSQIYFYRVSTWYFLSSETCLHLLQFLNMNRNMNNWCTSNFQKFFFAPKGKQVDLDWLSRWLTIMMIKLVWKLELSQVSSSLGIALCNFNTWNHISSEALNSCYFSLSLQFSISGIKVCSKTSKLQCCFLCCQGNDLVSFSCYLHTKKWKRFKVLSKINREKHFY